MKLKENCWSSGQFGRIKKKFRGKSKNDDEKKVEPKKKADIEDDDDDDDEDGDLSKYKLDVRDFILYFYVSGPLIYYCLKLLTTLLIVKLLQ